MLTYDDSVGEQLFNIAFFSIQLGHVLIDSLNTAAKMEMHGVVVSAGVVVVKPLR